MNYSTQRKRDFHGRFTKGSIRIIDKAYIENRVEIDEAGCWLWQRAKDKHGYGRIQIYKKENDLTIRTRVSRKAHRIAYVLYSGVIPEGLVLDHLCEVRACVNPDHLEPVLQAENLRRGFKFRGRQEYCKRGHVYDEENTYIRPLGTRQCRACKKLMDNKWRKK